MVEVLQAQACQHDWQLLLPALSVLCAIKPVLLVGAASRHLQPFGPGLAARGLSPERLLWVDTPDLAAQLWSAEQGLRCPGVAAVLAWLPQDRRVAMPALRRLHLAAQTHGHALFVFRPAAVAQDASPAPLRIMLEPQAADSATDAPMRLRILKRRGPPLTRALDLPAQPDAVSSLLAASRARREQGRARPLPMPVFGLGLGSKVVNLLSRTSAVNPAYAVHLRNNILEDGDEAELPTALRQMYRF